MRLIIVLLAASLACGTAAAHGGGLDSKGCHTDPKTGRYHCHRSQRSALSASEPKAEGGCQAKSYCKEMKSCAEAKRYLKECGLRRLDRDGDGVPCESLCKKRRGGR